MTTWWTTRPNRALDYRCDAPGCGAVADTVHWVPYVAACREVLFACPAHDAGGYWATLDRLWDERGYVFDRLLRTQGGGAALGLLLERVAALRVVGETEASSCQSR